VRQQDDYQLSKDELWVAKANRELDKPNKTSNRNYCCDIKINRNDNVTIQNVANGQTQEMKYKKPRA
jgi:preprotein translocase subunit SecA